MVSPGCVNCYMFTAQRRYGQDPSIVTRTKTWGDPRKWQRAAEAAGTTELVFTCSWSDWFHEAADPWRDEAWAVVRECPSLHFQILTKRAGRIREHLPADWGEGGYPNVWLGVSVENQRAADKRIPLLLRIPAVVHFLSCEPLLGPVDIRGFTSYNPVHENQARGGACLLGGGKGRTGNRRAGTGLEGGETRMGSLERPSANQQVSSCSRGEEGTPRVLAGAGHGRRQEDERAGVAASMEAPAWADTWRDGDQPLERGERRQPPREPGVDDQLGQCEARGEGSRGWQDGKPERRGKPRSEALRWRRGGDQGKEIEGRGASAHSEGFRYCLSDGVENRQGRKAGLWVICGGESGPGYRPMDHAWARSIRDQCRDAGVPYFFKQSSGPRTEMGIELDGEAIREYPVPREVPAFAPTLFAGVA